jgi:nucleoside-diphosphate-sugar epimerase
VRRDPEEQIEIFNIGSGVPATIRETVENVCRGIGLKADLRFGARPYAPQEPMYLVADTARARRVLGWQPRTELAYAVWQLARSRFPDLEVRRPTNP